MSESNNIQEIVKRFKWIYLIIVVIGIVIVGRIIYLQFFAKEIVTTNDIYKTEVIPANRGSILSCDGRPLAVSMPFFEIRMDCTSVADSVFNRYYKDLASQLSRFFKDKSPAQYQKELLEARQAGNKYRLIGNRTVDYGELEEIRQFPIFNRGRFKGGLIENQKNKRNKPYGSLANRTIGYLNEAGGGVGIENSFDYKLTGTPGEQKIQRQLGGEWIPVNGEPVIGAVDGYDIMTTIDIDIQEAAEESLKKQLSLNDVFLGGTAVVMEVKTGAIRAIANMRKLSNGTFDESYNYALRDATEPGSTMKLASLVALLEDGYVTLDTPVDGGNGEWYYNKFKFSDTHAGGYGQLNVLKAFEKSSNVCFAKLVVEYYKGNESAFVSRILNMKLTERLNMEIEGEGTARLVSPEDRAWSMVSLPELGIGYEITVTPLHTLTFYNAIANDGKMMKPYLVENFQRDGIVQEEFRPQVVSGSICSKSTIKEVKKALRGVVQEGTATACNDPRYSISGKTGTAQIAMGASGYRDEQGYKMHQASFAGFFPSEDPKYSCIVVLYTGKTRTNFYGGSYAAPVFKRIADNIYTSHPDWKEPLFAQNTTPPDNPSIASGRAKEGKYTITSLPMKDKITLNDKGWVKIDEDDEGRLVASELKIEDGIIPDVKNMGLKDALYILENEGYIVNFKGKGRVSSQYPEAGTPLARNAKIEIILSE